MQRFSWAGARSWETDLGRLFSGSDREKVLSSAN